MKDGFISLRESKEAVQVAGCFGFVLGCVAVTAVVLAGSFMGFAL